MSYIKALILGLIAGITDIFPVSATGHVTLFSNIMKNEGEIDLLFLIALHIGTMIAVIITYRQAFSRCFYEFFSLIGDLVFNIKMLFTGKNDQRRKLIINTYRKIVALALIAMIPTVVIGFFVAILSETLVGNLLGSGIGMLVSALLLLVASFAGKPYKTPHAAKYFDSILIGAFQGFSGFPGISRVGMTTSAAFLSGFSVKLTLLFTYLLSTPAVIGAYVLEIIRTKSFISSVGIGYTLIAMLGSAVAGFFALKFAKNFITPKHSKYYAAYCLAIGAVSMIIYLVIK